MNNHILRNTTDVIIEQLDNNTHGGGIGYGSLVLVIKYAFLDSGDLVLQNRLESAILRNFTDNFIDNPELLCYMTKELERFNYNDRIQYILNLMTLSI